MRHSPANISTFSFALGSVAGSCLILSLMNFGGIWQLLAYLMFICVFHWLEYLMTATYNESSCSIDCMFDT